MRVVRNKKEKECETRDFLGGPVVKTSPPMQGGVGSIPGHGARISHALGPKNQSRKQKQYSNKNSIKGFLKIVTN